MMNQAACVAVLGAFRGWIADTLRFIEAHGDFKTRHVDISSTSRPLSS